MSKSFILPKFTCVFFCYIQKVKSFYSLNNKILMIYQIIFLVKSKITWFCNFWKWITKTSHTTRGIKTDRLKKQKINCSSIYLQYYIRKKKKMLMFFSLATIINSLLKWITYFYTLIPWSLKHLFTYPGRCKLEHPGVKAPGTPKMINFPFLQDSARLTLLFGFPSYKFTEGIGSPACENISILYFDFGY